MKYTYPLLIKKNHKQISSILCPDFKINFTPICAKDQKKTPDSNLPGYLSIEIKLENKTRNLNVILESCQKKLENLIKEMTREKKIVQKPSNIFAIEPTLEDSQDFWKTVTISVNHQKGIFQILVPKFFILNAFLTEGLTGLAVTLSLQLTTKDDNSAYVLAGINTLIRGILTIITYYYAGSAENLASLGSKIDNHIYKLYLCCCRRKHLEAIPLLSKEPEEEEEDDLHTYSKLKQNLSSTRSGFGITGIGIKMIFIFMLLYNAVTSAIDLFQNTNALGIRANNQYLTPNVMFYVAIIYACSVGLTSVTFQSNFLIKMSDHFSSLFAQRKNRMGQADNKLTSVVRSSSLS